jgi:formylglycine-generating enzyme required for sulfatase activity
MGCNEEVDNECLNDEKPYREVYLDAYKIDKYEVTVEEYQKCIDAGNCNNNNNDEPHYSFYSEDNKYCNLGVEGRSNHPVNCVGWFGASAYCEWVEKKLPTEAQWEKAARGTDGRKYPWGSEPEVSCEYAVTYDSETEIDGCGTDSTWAVGSKEKGISPYGAHDMIGNVWEWVNDRYASDYYQTSPSENPAGPESGDFRVVRGGSWVNSYFSLSRASSRVGMSASSGAGYNSGFRCAK